MILFCDYINNEVIEFIQKEKPKTIVTFFKLRADNHEDIPILFFDDYSKWINPIEFGDKINEILLKINEEFNHNPFLNYGINVFQYYRILIKEDLIISLKFLKIINLIKKINNDEDLCFYTDNISKQRILKRNDFNLINYRSTKTSFKGIKKQLINYIIKSNLLLLPLLLLRKRGKTNKQILWVKPGRNVKTNLRTLLEAEANIVLLSNDINAMLYLFRKKTAYNIIFLPHVKRNKKQMKRWLDMRFEAIGPLVESLFELNVRDINSLVKINYSEIYELLRVERLKIPKQKKINLVLVEQSIKEIPKLIVEKFNESSTPTYELLHGVPSSFEVGLAKKTICFGKRDEIFFKNHGLREDKIIISGNPFYDNFYISRNTQTFEFFLLILDPIRQTDFSKSEEENYSLVINMLELMKGNNENLVIKLHHRQTDNELNYINYLIADYQLKDRVSVIRDMEMLQLLKRSKIVFCFNSSVGVEAIILHKPLIILDFIPGRNIEYEKYAAAEVVTSFDELVTATENITNNIMEYIKTKTNAFDVSSKFFNHSGKNSSNNTMKILMQDTN